MLHESIASQRPKTVAVVEVTSQEGTVRHTFGQLEEDSNRVASLLVERLQGSSGQEPIGVCLDGYLSIVALLGVMKSGNLYVPFDASYPTDRIKYMAQDCGVAIVLTDANQANRGPFSGGWFNGLLVELDSEWEEICTNISSEAMGDGKKALDPMKAVGKRTHSHASTSNHMHTRRPHTYSIHLAPPADPEVGG